MFSEGESLSMISPLVLLAVLIFPQPSAAPQQATAGTPPGFVLWPKGIPPGGLSEKDSFGNHVLSISHRDKDGLAEVHDKLVDVMIVQSGEATLVVGGEAIDATTTEPGEIRGKSIRGGIKREVRPGDVIRIPAKTPHQFFVPKGGQITYVLVKIAAD
jgi:mannose-6-phosphate isomerase-like protein (cupin superfamily)